MSVADSVTQKAGPLPVWGWGLAVGVVGIGARYFLTRKRGADTTNTDSASAPSSTISGSDLTTTDGWGSAPYTSGVAGAGVPASGGVLDSQDAMSLSSINPATGNPYIQDIGNPIDPATGIPYAQEVSSAAGNQQAWDSERQRLLDQIANNAQPATEATPVAAPPPTPMVTPTPPVPAPVQANPVNTGPLGGRKVGPWATQAERDKAVAAVPPQKVRKYSYTDKGHTVYAAEIFG